MTPAGATELAWVAEPEPVWDADKQRVIGGAPSGAFVLPFAPGERLPGEWWSVRVGAPDGEVVAYGRLDVDWGGDAQILLAVDPAHQGQGIGSFLLTRLEDEAAGRDINYVWNRIRDHEARDLVHDWLVVRGFAGPVDGDLRKRVGARPTSHPADASRAPQARLDDETTAPETSAPVHGVPADAPARAPGEEEQGGYVDVDEHRY